MKKIISLLISMTFLSGCTSISDINAGFKRVDRAWQLEYQKTEDLYRYRVIDAPMVTTFDQVKKTFLDLGMPIQKSSLSDGYLIAENVAPNPLTKEEWLQVREIEQPRVKEIGGWMFSLNEDPSGYIVVVKASMTATKNKTLVLLDYKLRMPKYERMGMTPSEHAPPLAVQLGSLKFWNALKINLKAIGVSEPRKRNNSELYAQLSYLLQASQL